MASRSLFALRVVPSLAVRQVAGAVSIAVILLFWWWLTSGATPEARVISPSVFPSPTEVIAGFSRVGLGA